MYDKFGRLINLSRQLAEQGQKAKLRRIRHQKTRQEKLLAKVGSKWRLIDKDWLGRAFRKTINDLEAQEKDILEKLHDLNELPDD